MGTSHHIGHDNVDAFIGTIPKEAFIGGEWRSSSDGARFDVCDPSSTAVLASVADCTVEDATAAVDAAHGALFSWSKTAPRKRSEILRSAFEIFHQRADELAHLVTLENGKALAEAKSEIAFAAEFFRWYSEEAVRIAGEVMTSPAGTNQILVLRQPIGVAALVTPWNFPAAMLTRKIAPALAAGCTVVCKPAPETPLTALAIANILVEAGLPGGVVNIVPTNRAASFVRTLLEDPRVRKLSFTGSTEVGRELLSTAGKNVVSCSMELGGNAPFIVFDDADVEKAVAGAMVAKMRNGGEACTAANRIYVQRAIADEFSAGLVKAMSELVVGPGLDEGVNVGPLVNEEGRDKVTRLVDSAVAGGARLLLGGIVPEGKGWFYPPTVLVDVPADAPILKHEIFGPVAPIIIFDEEDEVIELANDCEFGLVGYIFTSDLKRGLRVSERLETGMVGLNRGLVADTAAPFGGVKQSGIGREGGHEGLLEYLELKYIAYE